MYWDESCAVFISEIYPQINTISEALPKLAPAIFSIRQGKYLANPYPKMVYFAKYCVFFPGTNVPLWEVMVRAGYGIRGC